MFEWNTIPSCSLIKSRLDNQFYRRTTAIQFDVRYIATNAECYNRPRTDIVKNARILTDLVLRIIQERYINGYLLGGIKGYRDYATSGRFCLGR